MESPQHISALPFSYRSLKPCFTGEVSLSKCALLALSAPLDLGSEPITPNLPLLRRDENCIPLPPKEKRKRKRNRKEERKKEKKKNDGCTGQCLIKGMAVWKSRTKPFPHFEYQSPLVSWSPNRQSKAPNQDAGQLT